MKNYSSKTLIIGSVLIFTFAGLLYSLLAPKVYSSKSHVALFRLKVEDPDSNMEESRNRWIWVRDGLNLRSALVTQEMIDKVIASDEAAKEIAKKFPNTHLAFEHFSKMIDIQFTGADENNYLVEVKSPSPQLSYALNQAVFERIKYLATTADQKKFDDLINAIKIKQQELKDDQSSYGYYQDKIKKLTLSNIIEQKQRENAFEIIAAPTLNEVAVWPRCYLILVTSAFIGLVAGLALDFFRKHCESCQKN
jgi:LPS O-antigen subunit length determinant protein (WzzB/FepE family)